MSLSHEKSIETPMRRQTLCIVTTYNQPTRHITMGHPGARGALLQLYATGLPRDQLYRARPDLPAAIAAAAAAAAAQVHMIELLLLLLVEVNLLEKLMIESSL